jgi:hypothetical protein
VYVDDFLLSGPVGVLSGLWEKLKKEIVLGAQGPLAHFLGCSHTVSDAPTTSDKHRKMIQFNMSGYLQQSVEAYREQTNDVKPFLPVDTPSLTDEPLAAEFKPGVHAVVAQSCLPKLLYAARLARPDLVLPINVLSRYLTKWTAHHDRALRRLFAYVWSTLGLCLHGFVGGGEITINMFVDADFAGCLDTARSTSGLWCVLGSKGGEWSFPLEWGSKRQSCVAHSTPEAELVALAKGLRESALPLCSLLDVVLKRNVHVFVNEDNTSTIQIVNKGKSPALRHLAKTHRISLGWVAEVCKGESITLQHCDTALQLADSFTKPLDRVKHQSALKQLNIF